MGSARGRGRSRGRAIAVVKALALVASGVAGAPSGLSAQVPDPPPGELAWVGLFNPELVGWLENENRMELLCDEDVGSPGRLACEAAHLAPMLLVIPVRAEPHPDAERLGELVVTSQPGRGLRLHASTGGRAEPFTPDLFLEDWGYGPPYFHLTVLERREPWFRVPIPGIGRGWIDGEEWVGAASRPHVEFLRAGGQVITTPQGDMVVLGLGEGVMRARLEQAADMWCEPGEPPPLAPWREVRIPFSDLFDSAGRSLISYKYMKGC